MVSSTYTRCSTYVRAALPLYDVNHSLKEFANKHEIEVASALKRAAFFKTRHTRTNLVAEAGVILSAEQVTLVDGLLPDRGHKAHGASSHLCER